ncbi:MAG: lysophospholipid acyltransferase family protein [Chloroflexota bacterium]
MARVFLWSLFRAVVFVRARLTIRGLENFPKSGPGLIVFNHLGDADAAVILSHLYTLRVDPLGASNLYDDHPWIRVMGEAYGTIWLHRGHPDRRALTCALESLKRGRFVIIAPEGRESLAGGLEEGLDGAAFLALKAGVPIIPITVTHTENKRMSEDLRHLRRTPVAMTVGTPFRLETTGERHADLRSGTERIMRELARLLPSEYQGMYRTEAG